jgi:hypothetical protein
MKQQLSTPEKHQMRIAKQTLKMSDIGASIMGGMTKQEAREFLKEVGFSLSQIAQIEDNE